MHLAGIPLDPDADTAREWVEHELEKNVYHGVDQGWLTRLASWLNGIFDHINLGTGSSFSTGISGGLVALILLVALLGLLGYVIVGPLRRSHRVRTSARVFDDDLRTQAQMDSAARSAAAAGDWDLAVMERFRAIVRQAEQDEAVAVVPGMTAYEFVTHAAEAAAPLASDLLWAGDLFDGVRYGHASGTPAAFERLGTLARAMSSRRAAMDVA